MFEFHLAHELGCQVGALDGMPHDEYVKWAAYFEARNAKQTER